MQLTLNTSHNCRLDLLGHHYKNAVEAWFDDLDYQDAMVFRHAVLIVNYLLFQEGSVSTQAPDFRPLIQSYDDK